MRTLLYVGFDSPWRDIRRFVQVVKKKHHRINSDEKMRQLVARTTVEASKTQRAPHYFQFIPGADLLTEDIEQIPCWGGLSPVKQEELKRATILQRKGMIRLTGLTRSYAWSERNQWAQQVEDGDYDIIMATDARKVMWDPDIKGEWTPAPRAYDDPELFPMEKISAQSHQEIELILKERKRHNYVPGATLG